jgi:hypothetical protein
MRAINLVGAAVGVIAGILILAGAGCPSAPAGSTEVVTLSHPIFTKGGPDYSPGDVFPLSLITDGVVQPPDAFCAVTHLDAIDPAVGILINGLGPYPDPDINGCGYGAVTFEVFPTVVP